MGQPNNGSHCVCVCRQCDVEPAGAADGGHAGRE